MDIKNNISVAILAGGNSSRFGAPKHCATFRSSTLLEIMLHTASAISDDIFIIAGQNRIEPQKNNKVYQDMYPHCGPLGGIYTAAFYTDRAFLMTLPCDMPLLPAAVYEILWENASTGYPVSALSHRGPEPLVSVWPVCSSLPVLTENLKQGKYSLKKTFEELGAVYINIEESMPEYRQEMFSNINYRSDLLELEFREKEGHVFDGS